MKTKRSIFVVMSVPLIVLFHAVSVFAHPAESPDISPARIPSNACRSIQSAFSQSDISARRIDYIMLDRAEQCAYGYGKVDLLIVPVTGVRESRYYDFKVQQADLMSERNLNSSYPDRHWYYDFKQKQAEERSYGN
jgi:hypothetical protein